MAIVDEYVIDPPKRPFWVIILILAVLPITYYGWGLIKNMHKPVPLPPTMAMDLDGNSWSLASHKGHVVFMNGFATWCGPCREELPGIADLAAKYAPKGVDFVGVAADPRESPDSVRSLAVQFGLPYPIIQATPTQPIIPNLNAFPTTLILDRNGNVLQTLVGSRDEKTFSDALDAALASR